MKFICFNDIEETRINLENIVAYYAPKKASKPIIKITHCGGVGVSKASGYTSKEPEIWLTFESDEARDRALQSLDGYCLWNRP